MDEPALTIELVPSSSWYSNVRSHVSGRFWDKIRKDQYKKSGYLCDICFGRGPNHPVECHEIWFYDDDELTQTLIDFTSLCPACHEVKHFGLASKNGRQDEAIAHLSYVNGWDLKRSWRYVESQFRLWELRSMHDWELNLELIGILYPEEKENYDDCR